MFGLQILDIGLGLVFVYLLLSLICTAAGEMFASWTNSRAGTLEQGIRHLLNDPDLDKAFHDHPLIKCISKDGKHPSYIPSRTFALVLMDLVMPATSGASGTEADMRAGINNMPQDIRRTLMLLLDDAEGNMKVMHDKIEIWFNHTMDRVSGWYKRKAQTVTLFLALVITVVANADTIAISRSLANDPALRDAIVAQAEQYAAQAKVAPPATDSTAADTTNRPSDRIRQSINELEGMGLPLGWTSAAMPHGGEGWTLKIIGLLLTACAVSLGAPFWFDILNKIIQIRSAGKSPDEVSKPPEAKPKRAEEVPPQ